MTSPVRIAQTGRIAWVTIDNPPVNATSTAVRQGLMEVAHKVAGLSIDVIVLKGAGKVFVAGGDMSEFDALPVEPHLPDVVDAIEKCPVPWVAAMHGAVLGGGLELALGCAWRFATPDATFGLPEVNVGLVPGAGGTQRLPRLVGPALAVDMATSGKPVRAQVFLAAGGIDRILPDLDEATLTAVLRDLPKRPPAASARRIVQVEDGWWDDRRKAVASRAKGQLSPGYNLDMVRLACTTPFAEGQSQERALHLALRHSDQSRALRHAFFAERAAARPDAIVGGTPREIASVAVVGGGLMGAGIATACLNAGLPVVLVERDMEAAEAGRDRVRQNLEAAVRRRRATPEQVSAKLTRLTVTDKYVSAASADIAIEAVFEDLAVKRAVFAKLSEAMREDALLATNTSYLDPNLIFEAVPNPDRCLGLHFFTPAHVMKLLEIVRTTHTTQDTLASGFALSRRLRKTAVLSGVCNGFIGNRMLAAYRRQADYLLADGASPQQIDAAMTSLGMPLGPYAIQDLTGLQIAWANRKSVAPTRDPAERYVSIADQLCEARRFGQRNGAGWYRYENGSKAPIPDPNVERIVNGFRDAKGIVPQSFAPEDISNRVLAVLVNEGALILEEGIAQRPGDVDTVQIAGYGFPRWLGGPMHLASQIGMDKITGWMRDVAGQSPGSWRISNRLMEC